MRTERSADCSSTPLCGLAISTEARGRACAIETRSSPGDNLLRSGAAPGCPRGPKETAPARGRALRPLRAIVPDAERYEHNAATLAPFLFTPANPSGLSRKRPARRTAVIDLKETAPARGSAGAVWCFRTGVASATIQKNTPSDRPVCSLVYSGCQLAVNRHRPGLGKETASA
jgi:hypothetical protein